MPKITPVNSEKQDNGITPKSENITKKSVVSEIISNQSKSVRPTQKQKKSGSSIFTKILCCCCRIKCCHIGCIILALEGILSMALLLSSTLWATVHFTQIMDVGVKMRTSVRTSLTEYIEEVSKTPRLTNHIVHTGLMSGVVDTTDFLQVHEYLNKQHISAMQNNNKNLVYFQISFYGRFENQFIGYYGQDKPDEFQPFYWKGWASQQQNLTDGIYTQVPPFDITKPYIKVLPASALGVPALLPAPRYEKSQFWEKAQVSSCGEFLAVCPVSKVFTTYTKEANSQNVSTSFRTTFSTREMSLTLVDLVDDVPGMTAFVIEQETGHIIASSMGDIKYYKESNLPASLSTVLEIYKVDEFDKNTLIQDVGKRMKEKYGSSYKVGGTQSMSFFRNGQKYIVDMKDFNDGFGLDLTMVTVVAELSMLGNQIWMGSSIAAGSFLLIVFGLFVGLFATCCVALPMRRLINDIKHVESMNLDKINTEKKSTSMFKEISRIQLSFRKMVKQLKDYKSFLPDYILRRDFHEGGDDEDIHNDLESLKSGQSRTRTRQSITESLRSGSTLRSGRHQQKLSKFQRHLQSRNVACLTLKISCDHCDLSEVMSDNYVEAHGKVVEMIQEAVHLSRGDLHRFDHESITVTWGASFAIKEGALKAIQAALSVDVRMKEFLTHCPVQGLNYTIGVAFGRAIVGCLGTKKSKRFSIYGYPLEMSEALTKLKKMNRKIHVVVDENLIRHPSIKTDFVYRPLMQIRLPYASLKSIAYEMVEQKSTENREWLYERKRDARYDNFKKLNDAFNMMHQHHYAAALEKYENFLQEERAYEDDSTLLGLLKYCQSQVDHAGASNLSVPFYQLDNQWKMTQRELKLKKKITSSNSIDDEN